MNRPLTPPASGSSPADPPGARDGSVDPRGDAIAARNFLTLAAYQVALRCGWIFKTESIVMPIVLDLLHSSAWVRSLLPLLNRLGQSLPPLLLADRVRAMPRKRRGLAAASAIMAAVFLGLSAAWTLQDWISLNGLRLLFLSAYTLFFVATGVTHVCFNTLQGKLVRATRRGLLMLVANVVGAASAVVLVLVFLPRWLAQGSARFAWIFGFSGGCFLAATGLCLLLIETPDEDHRRIVAGWQPLRQAVRTLREDRRFRRLSLIAALFGASLILFPHYQALGRGQRLGIGLREIVTWIVVQNVGTAVFSLAVGPLADRRGNRNMLRWTLAALASAPLLAIALSLRGPPAAWAFPAVFLLVGLTPVILRILNNYTLELAPPEDHPRYLATINVCIAAPVMLAPLAGWSLAWIGFDGLFCGISAMLLLAWTLTFGLFEPRHA